MPDSSVLQSSRIPPGDCQSCRSSRSYFVSHYFGLNEEEIMEIEEKYWRSEDDGA